MPIPIFIHLNLTRCTNIALIFYVFVLWRWLKCFVASNLISCISPSNNACICITIQFTYRLHIHFGTNRYRGNAKLLPFLDLFFGDCVPVNYLVYLLWYFPWCLFCLKILTASNKRSKKRKILIGTWRLSAWIVRKWSPADPLSGH